MNLFALTLVPAFRFGGGEKWQLKCLRALRPSFSGVRFLSTVNDLPPQGALGDMLVRSYDFDSDEWGQEYRWSHFEKALASSSHVWIFQYQASDVALEVLLNVPISAKTFLTNLGCEPARFFSSYVPCRSHRFIEISRFAAMRTARFVPNVGYVWCGYDAPSEAEPVAHAKKKGYVMVGRMLPHKRPDFLVESWTSGDPVLRLVGSCPDASFLKKLQGGFEGKPIEIFQDAPGELRDRLIAESLGLIAPSSIEPEQSELLGLVIFEALQCGTIPVASSIPSYLEVMEALGLGDWVFRWDDPGDLHRVLDRLGRLAPCEYTDIVQSAREAAREKFHWDNIVPLLTQP